MRYLIPIILSFCLIFSLAGCTQEAPKGASTAPTESVVTTDPVLLQRRETVVEHMRSMANVLWRPDADMLYALTSKTTPEEAPDSKKIQLYADRIYKGVPYSYAGGTEEAFSEYLHDPDDRGIYTLSGLDRKNLSGGGNKYVRVGNDCSSAVIQAWSRVGCSVTMTNTKYMTPNRGFLRVGNYESNAEINENTSETCLENGAETMYAAYAQLQKGDAVVARWETQGHARLISDINVVYTEDGSIDSSMSYVLVIEQTSSNLLNQMSYYDTTLGAEVYYVYSIDVMYTFESLFRSGYLPITCKELIDPTPVPDAEVNDSLDAHNVDNLFSGTISTNHYIDTVTVTITDSTGATVQECALRALRENNRQIALSRFLTEDPGYLRGSIDLNALPSGSYHCSMNCRLTNNQIFLIRDFDFTR